MRDRIGYSPGSAARVRVVTPAGNTTTNRSLRWRILVGALAFPLAVSAIAVGPLAAADHVQAPTQAQQRFTPGALWLDTAGKPINAHGGGMLFYANTYYWYGEDKTGRTWMPRVNQSWDGYRVEVTGIRCYASKDLYAWEDQGLVLKAVPDDPAHDLHPSKVVERPKVAFNPKTRKFVMWLHIDSLDYQ